MRRLLTLVCIGLLAAPPAYSAGFDDAARLVIMIESQIDDQTQQGAGILFSIVGDSAYAFTANHVVRAGSGTARKITVYVKDAPQTPLTARALPEFDARADLALIEIPGLRAAGLARLGTNHPPPFELFGAAANLKRGAPAFPIGYPGGIAWGSPIKPDSIDRSEPDRILFQSAYVSPGHSGGGLFSADWHLIGMIIEAARAPTVAALPIEGVLRRLSSWNHPVGIQTSWLSRVLQPDQPGPAKAATSYGNALYEEFAPDGRVFIRTTTWGPIAADPERDTVTLTISKIRGLPKRDAPTYALAVKTPGSHYNIRINPDDKSFVSSPIPARELDDSDLQVLDTFLFRHDDEITERQRSSLAQLRNGLALRLPYSVEELGELRGKSPQREVWMFVQAQLFDPDGDSGGDQLPASPTKVARGRAFSANVDYERGNATDHLEIRRGAAACRGVLMLQESEGTITVTSSPIDTEANASKPSASFVAQSLPGPFDRRSTVYSLNCTQGSLLRVQAKDADSKSSYAIYVGQGEHNAGTFKELMLAWLEAWEPSATDNDRIGPAQVSRFRRASAELMQVTTATPAELIGAYEAYLQKSSDWSEHKLRLMDALMMVERPTLETELARCCEASAGVRFFVNLHRAEAGLTFDRKAVAWARRLDLSDNEQLLSRVNRAIGPAK